MNNFTLDLTVTHITLTFLINKFSRQDFFMHFSKMVMAAKMADYRPLFFIMLNICKTGPDSYH